MVLQQVFVEAHVFFLRQDRVVGLHAVFLEERGISVENWISALTVYSERSANGTYPWPWISILVGFGQQLLMIGEVLALDVPSRGFSRQMSAYS